MAADPRCVGEARRLTLQTLDSWGLPALRETASLLVSELMTNALLHARSGVDVVLHADPALFRVDVCDHSPLPPRVRHFSADAGTGRGVRLLDTMATEWGVVPMDGGKCVWFTLSTGQPPTPVTWDFDFYATEAL